MKQDEYNKWNDIVIKSMATTAIVISLVAGCHSAFQRTEPDTLSAGDKRSIAQHAQEYWSKEVEEETPLPISDEENAEIDGYKDGYAAAVRAIRDRCLKQHWFQVDGRRFNCEPI